MRDNIDTTGHYFLRILADERLPTASKKCREEFHRNQNLA